MSALSPSIPVYEYHCKRCGIWRFSDERAQPGPSTCRVANCGRAVTLRFIAYSLRATPLYCATGRLHTYGVSQSAASAIGADIAEACADGWCTVEDAARILNKSITATHAAISRGKAIVTVRRHRVGKATLLCREDVLTLRDALQTKGARG